MTARPAEATGGQCSSDWVGDRRVFWLWPVSFAVAGLGWLAVPGLGGALLAAVGLGVAGALCVGNALRCRRFHCALTGPLYLIAAGLFLARAGGFAVPAGWIVAGVIAGTVVAYIPEWFGTRYFEPAERASARATTGTLLAAGLVAACCLGPTLFVIFGVSLASLGALGVLEPYRWLFLLAGLACWAVAFRARHRAVAACPDETCGTPASRRLSRVVLWGSLAALLAAAMYPYVVALVV